MRTSLLILSLLVSGSALLHADGLREVVEKLDAGIMAGIDDGKPDLEMEMTVLVNDAATGAPIPGADVRVIVAEGSARAVTGSTGEAVAPLPKTSTSYLTVTVSHPLYVPTRARWYLKNGTFPVPDTYALELEPGKTIGGQVVNAEGEPVSDAVVSLRLAERSRRQEGMPVVDAHLWREQVTTDHAGRWSYGRAPQNLEELNLKVTHPLYVEKDLNYPDVVLEKQRELLVSQQEVITLERGATVVGRVVDPDGQAVPNAAVKLRAPRIGSVKAAVTATDGEGRFFFPAVADGTMTLLADAPGKGPGLIRYELDGEAPLMDVPLEQPHRVFGRVVTPGGEPVAGAAVSMELWRGTVDIQPVAVTDRDGYFSWNEAPGDQAMFRVSKNGFISNRVPLFTDEDQEVVLSAKRIVRGKVVDAATGEPVHTFQIMLGTGGADGSVVWFQTEPLIYGYGQYRLNLDVPSDNLVVGVKAAGYRDAQSDVIAQPEVIEKIHFQLERE
ncbi:MAG: carboxypeptidase-like regulatory domain-containing protein [Verrucomicrobiota bacterium]